MILDISHITHYHFGTAPQYGLQQIRLSPQAHAGQRILDWDLSFTGATVEADYTDHYQNIVHLISLDSQITELTVKSQGRLEMTNTSGIVGPHSGYTPLWLFLRQTPLTRPGNGVLKLASDMLHSNGTVLEKLHALSRSIGGLVHYETGRTDSLSTAEDAIKTGAGVCQDHSHIFISVARASGLPARYVSGYLMMNDRVSQDATHAWAEVYIDSLGWVGFDVSNQISPDERYVRVAMGLDYSEAAPISGLTFGGSDESITVDVQVQQ